MKVIVLIKQVYDPETVRVSRSLGILDTREAEFMMNPGDRYALEEALKLKDNHGAHVVAVSLGPGEADDVLREALATGVDEAVLLADEAFSNVDSSGATMVVGEAIKRIGDYDLIVTGYQAAGDGTGEFGPRLAQYLGLPQILGATELSVDDTRLTARRALSSAYAVVEAELPAVVSVAEAANRPRHPSLPGSIAAYEQNTVAVWDAEEFGISGEMISANSCTEVRATFAGPERERGRTIGGEAAEAARELLAELRSRGLLAG
jgi:electron transfer flavoprotein alpha/beta subunit